MDAGEIFGLAGLSAGIIWLVLRPQLRWTSLVAALVAVAAGEVTLTLASTSSAVATSWWSLAFYYPLAVLSVGGWAIVLSGLACAAIGTPRPDRQISVIVAAYLVGGALAGVGLSSAMILTRLGEANSAGYLFGSTELLLAGVVAGIAGGGTCIAWRLGQAHPQGC